MMQLSASVLASAALCGFASAYTTAIGNPSGNPLFTPALNQIVPAGTKFNITWEPTTAGSIDLVLFRGPATNLTPIYAIATSIPNSGSYLWNVGSSLQPDTTHYGIQLIVDATGANQYTDQFGISVNGSTSASSPVATQSSDGQPEVPATIISVVTTGSSTITVTFTTLTASISANSLTTSLNASTTAGSAPLMGMLNTTVILPTVSMSVPASLTSATLTQAATSATASTAGASRMAEGCGAAVMGMAGMIWAVL